MKKKYLSLALLLVLAASIFCFSPAIPTVRAHNPTWWDYDWHQRLELTINHTLIDDDLIDFPVLVYVGNDTLDWGDVQNNLDDIRFTGDILDELSFEIDFLTLNYEAWFWVRLPEVSSSLDTYFFMYFDNKFCTSGENAEAVWDEYTVMVQHMNDETTSTILDSTSNDNDGVKKDVNEPIETDGQIGKAQQYDANDYIDVADNPTLDTLTSFTFTCWVKLSEFTGVARYVLDSGYWADTGIVIYNPATNNRIYFGVKNNIAEAASADYITLTPDTLTQIGLIYDGSNLKSIINGVVGGGTALTGTVDTTTSFTLGARTTHTQSLNGLQDEVQFSKDVARSDAWVGASYYSGTLELVIVGYHYHPPDTALRGEFIAAALVASLILVPLLILFIFAARRKR